MAKKPYRIERKLIKPMFIANGMFSDINGACFLNDWTKYRKYATLQDAEKALEALNNKSDVFEYRLIK